MFSDISFFVREKSRSINLHLKKYLIYGFKFETNSIQLKNTLVIMFSFEEMIDIISQNAIFNKSVGPTLHPSTLLRQINSQPAVSLDLLISLQLTSGRQDALAHVCVD